MRAGLSIRFLVCMGEWTQILVQGGTSVEQTVRSLHDQERIAALKRDVPALERVWSDHFTVNAPNNQVVIGNG